MMRRIGNALLPAAIAMAALTHAALAENSFCTQDIDGLTFCASEPIKAIEIEDAPDRLQVMFEDRSERVMIHIRDAEALGFEPGQPVETFLSTLVAAQSDAWKLNHEGKTFEMAAVRKMGDWPATVTRAIPPEVLSSKTGPEWHYASAFVCNKILLIQQVARKDHPPEDMIRLARQIVSATRVTSPDTAGECASNG